MNMPVHSGRQESTQLLGNLAQDGARHTASVVNHYNVQPVYDVYANVQDRDLGGFSNDVEKVVDEYQIEAAAGQLYRNARPGGDHAGLVHGHGLRIGVRDSVGLLPDGGELPIVDGSVHHPDGAAGRARRNSAMLFFTQTTISVPALMGAIMSIGVGTANSILLVTFANDLRREGMDAMTAAYEAGRTRLRPVVMTAVAMLAGMVPMAMGLGEGGEQNAPLGRAVIGGLMMATVATLFVVPVVYSMMRKTPPKRFEQIEEVAD